MPQLNDTQTILLSAASQRQSGSLLPLPATLTNVRGQITKAIAALIRMDVIEERQTDDLARTHREDGNLRYGLFITADGLTAIGVEVPDEPDVVGADPAPAAAAAPARATKAGMVVDLLKRPEGATLPDLIAATGWLPHTTRAALTGLRKKGHAIDKGKRDGVTCYRIMGAA